MRLLADENVDHRVVHRLENYGHDIEHVDVVGALGKGSADAAIAQYALDTDRLLLTSDDDFLTEFTDEDYRGLLFITDERLSVGEVSEIVHTIGETVDHAQLETVVFVSRAWL